MRTSKISIFVGVAVLALTVGLNVRHALNDYGVKTNKLHLEVLAQTSTTGGGSTSGGGGTGTGTGTDIEMDTVGYSCSLSDKCPDGLTISCTGQVCKAGKEGDRKWVECDLKKTWCRA